MERMNRERLYKDEDFMLEAIKLAKKGLGFTNPNPMVGAVIVKNGHIIGRGYHKAYGGLHAEREAIKDCKTKGNEKDLKGATIYVTLEPCCHYGKQPPCTMAIIEAGITRVVVGALDPNPKVCGKGIKILEEAGIKVDGPILNEACLEINDIFFHYMRYKKPLVTLKWAQTLDGKIACYTGESKWITGDEARQKVHMDRHKNMAILVGIGTLLKDDPMLNCRNETLEKVRHPLRIVLDSNLRTPFDSNFVKTATSYKSLIMTVSKDKDRIESYKKFGVDVVSLEADYEGRVNLVDAINYLGEKGIDSLIIEGGGEINYKALESRIVDKIQVYIAPKIFGGKDAITAVLGTGIASPKDAFKVGNLKVSRLGEDLLLEGDMEYS